MANLNVAKTILAQLGGGRFTAMTGAKYFTGDEQSLMFSLPSRLAKDGINKVRITLDWTDTYILEAMKISRGPNPKCETIQKLEYIYADGLQQAFTSVTGLNTHL